MAGDDLCVKWHPGVRDVRIDRDAAAGRSKVFRVKTRVQGPHRHGVNLRVGT
jgi:hypothetical protein